MQGRLKEFRSLGAEVLVISFVEPARLQQYLKLRPWRFRVLTDPGRNAYQSFGLGRAKWHQLLRPRVLARYVALILRGRMPHRAQEDIFQLGGDFVLDKKGQVVFEYRSIDPADRPDVSALLEAARGVV